MWKAVLTSLPENFSQTPESFRSKPENDKNKFFFKKKLFFLKMLPWTHIECSLPNAFRNFLPKVRKIFNRSPKKVETKGLIYFFFSKCSSGHIEWYFDKPAENIFVKTRISSAQIPKECFSRQVKCSFGILTF